MTREYRERAIEARQIMVSFRANHQEVDLIESALKPGENRSDFLIAAATSRAIARLKKLPKKRKT